MPAPRYPRDLLGYGASPPDAAWPGGAKIAVQFVVNYEEGGENTVLHGDAASEAFLSEIVGAAPWPGQRHMNMESIYEYGARAGFWRLHRMFTSRAIPVTVFGVATALARNPEAVAAMLEADWEIASHGLKWIDYRDYTLSDERAHMRQALAIHEAVTGARPLGWYTGRSSEHSLRVVLEEGGFLYSSDAYADDLPYWVEGAHKPHLVVPYTLDANDMRFATPQGFNSGEQFFAYLKDSFDILYAEGGAGAPKMMNVGLHCRLAGRPGRAAALARFLDYVQGFDGAWLARRIDIARHWHEHHAPALFERPSGMARGAFVEKFGGVFEHSPWIAEGAFAGELGPATDTARGLWGAMVAVFRSSGEARQLSVLKAHPDLAGRLALAKGLTASSNAEQASAGLDSLTEAELARFTRLNAAYTEKFGFPFIMAVKGRNKSEILAAFEHRAGNDAASEFSTACREVEKIALLRLKDLLPERQI
ncbi:allantoinase PuuE [Afifella sp. IM 167]|uniref:allantoinase PuuE n=1 Tax=Afifella sp. IM 167 TaxID=2033586 RepID=UPI001CC99227|nr:allantoinase PuuE [Afifella sp. IM 167]MBZ8135105.1 polysaccharide deacetylase [Afifella sp. IM 167]